jgi:Ca-activated chloride channel homolog
MRRLFALSLLLSSLTTVPATVYLMLSVPRLRHWFAQPWALTLLAVLPVVLSLILWNAERRRRALARLGSVLAIESLLTVRRGLGALRALALLLGLLFLILGVAGPQWGHDREQTAAPGRDLIVVLDCSRSMYAENPSRFERARRALHDLTDDLQKRGGHRIGLVVFAACADLACPLTHDYDHFRATLDDLDPVALPSELGPGKAPSADGANQSGTRIGVGLIAAVAAHDQHFSPATDILLLSDGDDPAKDQEWQKGIAAANADKIPVYVIGIGDPNEASTLQVRDQIVQTRLREEVLKEIADETGGKYIPAHTRALPLGKIYLETIANQPLREASIDALPLYRPRYVWVLLPALALLVVAVALPDRLPKLPRRRPRTPAGIETSTP